MTTSEFNALLMEGQLTPNSLMTTSPERKPVTELQAIRADERFPLIFNVIGNLLVLNRFRYVKYSKAFPLTFFHLFAIKTYSKLNPDKILSLAPRKQGREVTNPLANGVKKKP